MIQQNLEERFGLLEKELADVLSTKHLQYNALMNTTEEYVDHTKYTTWISKAKKLLEDSFGKDSDYYNDFKKAQKGFYSTSYHILSKQLKPVFDAAKQDLKYTKSESKKNTIAPKDNLDIIINLLNRFPAFCRQLSKRYNNRETLEIKDEYDVQDLIHALLKLHFDDIRPEEYTPSFAGAASRQDFLLKDEKIVIEVKKTRKSLGASKIGEELVVDIARYSVHQDCETLICFVYDPEYWINNPKGVVADLESLDTKGKVKVIITQL
ncbi:malate dehydrogenase [Pantoea ananatis]|uniref:PD-(D/E)XK nuclease domain-containing protein n=1 Tax=Pantoea ananas TaxID=553 RepID=UPI003017F59E